MIEKVISPIKIYIPQSFKILYKVHVKLFIVESLSRRNILKADRFILSRKCTLHY